MIIKKYLAGKILHPFFSFSRNLHYSPQEWRKLVDIVIQNIRHCSLGTDWYRCLGTDRHSCLWILQHLSSWTLLGTCRLCSLGTDWHCCRGTDRHSCLWTLNLSWNWTAQLLWYWLYCWHGHEHVMEFHDPCNVSIDLDNPLHSSLLSFYNFPCLSLLHSWWYFFHIDTWKK